MFGIWVVQKHRWKKVEAAAAPPVLICHSCAFFVQFFHAIFAFFVCNFGPFCSFLHAFEHFLHILCVRNFQARSLPVLFCQLFPSLGKKSPDLPALLTSTVLLEDNAVRCRIGSLCLQVSPWSALTPGLSPSNIPTYRKARLSRQEKEVKSNEVSCLDFIGTEKNVK